MLFVHRPCRICYTGVTAACRNACCHCQSATLLPESSAAGMSRAVPGRAVLSLLRLPHFCQPVVMERKLLSSLFERSPSHFSPFCTVSSAISFLELMISLIFSSKVPAQMKR